MKMLMGGEKHLWGLFGPFKVAQTQMLTSVNEQSQHSPADNQWV